MIDIVSIDYNPVMMIDSINSFDENDSKLMFDQITGRGFWTPPAGRAKVHQPAKTESHIPRRSVIFAAANPIPLKWKTSPKCSKYVCVLCVFIH